MYEQHFGLKKRPFPAHASGAGIYEGPAQQRVLTALGKALAWPSAVVVVTGPVGAGKTVLVDRALEGVGRNRAVARIARLPLTRDELLELLLTEFGIADPPPGRVQRYASFRRLLAGWAQAGTRVVVVVEDALSLGMDALVELESLTAANNDATPGVQLILMGPPELRDVLGRADMARLRQRVRLREQIGPLTPGETANYLRHALEQAGAGPAAIIEPAAIAVLHAATEGLPRLINNLCEAALIGAAESGARSIGAALVERLAIDHYGWTPGARPASKPADAPAAAEPEPELIQDTLPGVAALAEPPAGGAARPQPNRPPPAAWRAEAERMQKLRSKTEHTEPVLPTLDSTGKPRVALPAAAQPPKPAPDQPARPAAASPTKPSAGPAAKPPAAQPPKPAAAAPPKPTAAPPVKPAAATPPKPAPGAKPAPAQPPRRAAAGPSMARPGAVASGTAATSGPATPAVPRPAGAVPPRPASADLTPHRPAAAAPAASGPGASRPAPPAMPAGAARPATPAAARAAPGPAAPVPAKPTGAKPAAAFDTALLEPRPPEKLSKATALEDTQAVHALEQALLPDTQLLKALEEPVELVPDTAPVPLGLQGEVHRDPVPTGKLPTLSDSMRLDHGSLPRAAAAAPKPAEPIPEITLDLKLDRHKQEAADRIAAEAAKRSALAAAAREHPAGVADGNPAEAAATPAAPAPTFDLPSVTRQLDELSMQPDPQKSRLDKVAAELGSARSIEDIDDMAAETLFGEEFSQLAAAVAAMAPPGFDEGEPAAAPAQPAAETQPPPAPPAAGPKAAAKPAARVPPPADIDESASRRLEMVRALNGQKEMPSQSDAERIVLEGSCGRATPGGLPNEMRGPRDQPIENRYGSSMTQTLQALHPPNAPDAAPADPPPAAPAKRGPQPEPIENQFGLSMTQTLNALSARTIEAMAVNGDDADDDDDDLDDDDDDEPRGGFFSRFRRS